MALRGRPASRVPDTVAAILARHLGRELDAHRAEGFGMLLGYADGLGFGLAYGMLRPRTTAVPWPVAGVLLALATLAPEFVAAALGATDPAAWGLEGWLSGLAPRLAYGLVTAATTERLR